MQRFLGDEGIAALSRRHASAPRRRRASAGAPPPEEELAVRQTRQPESYLDLHVARKPPTRRRSHQGGGGAVGTEQAAAGAAPALVLPEPQVAAEVRIGDVMEHALPLPAMLRIGLVIP